MKIGRYRIFLKYFLYQSKRPVIVRKWWIFNIVEDIDLTKTDVKQQFPLGTVVEHEGRKYFYMKAGKDIRVGELLNESHIHKDKP